MENLGEISPEISWFVSRTVPITHGSKPDRCLQSRGIVLSRFPSDLRMDKDQNITAIIRNPEGVGVSYQRTFFNPDGAAIKMMAKGIKIPPGSAIRLGRERDVMGVAEGVTTALSASLLSGLNGKERMPVWSAVTASGMKTFMPPLSCNRFYIFADNDSNGSGLRSAHAAKKLSEGLEIETRILMPPRNGSDWNDVLRELKKNDIDMKRTRMIQSSISSSNKAGMSL